MGRPNKTTATRQGGRFGGGGGGGGVSWKLQAVNDFVKLINGASGQWVNRTPTEDIEVGSFGEIDKETGRFQRRGNIYQDFKDPEGLPIYTEKLEDSTVFREHTVVTPRAHGSEVYTDIVGSKKQWQFGSTKEALLMMWNYRTISLPPSVLDAIQKNEHSELRELSLVTRVYTGRAQAFIYYLSNERSESFQVDMVPIIHAPTITSPRVTVGIEMNVEGSNMNDLLEKGFSENMRFDFTPLFECVFQEGDDES
ncbi:hypothetical protein SCHPADRAFT_898652 [Schizopora paradoxa]|uniref:Uncharacterized protein n=1 Tax=Schizopora paradoxa TaxID=27342 RepID=A0A0H2S607_9AGAM|nr:hypothetical protein SCHPADRAFT_898652 [Schizopora paradoxa]